MAPPLRWGLVDAVPHDAPAAWGCRAIDQGDRIDIVWDRVDCVGPDNLRSELRTLLADRFPPADLEARCVGLDRQSTGPAVVHDDPDLRVVALRTGGYVYVTGWLMPERFPPRRYVYLAVRGTITAEGDPRRQRVDRYEDARALSVWFDEDRIGLGDVLWVDTPPDGVVRTRYLRCQRCGQWLAGKATRWSDGYVYGDDCCWDERLAGFCEDHPDTPCCDDPDGGHEPGCTNEPPLGGSAASISTPNQQDQGEPPCSR